MKISVPLSTCSADVRTGTELTNTSDLSSHSDSADVASGIHEESCSISVARLARGLGARAGSEAKVRSDFLILASQLLLLVKCFAVIVCDLQQLISDEPYSSRAARKDDDDDDDDEDDDVSIWCVLFGLPEPTDC